MIKFDPIERTLELGTFLAFTCLIIIVTYQVVTRFLFPSLSKVWTEEASRLFFVYSVAFSAPLAMKKREYVNVDILINLFPKKIKALFELMTQLMTIILLGALLQYALAFAALGQRQLSPTMSIPMSVAYSSTFVALLFLLIYALVNFYLYIKSLREGGNRV